ncbi:unnamed protein product [Cyprideis torosa]|uniref:Uncharacterized protein n=1 Tax=Cyprideis torosa TaxID=163714 RepID=A0A7R8WER0_9CRUS|nr:unnamed protein product [Cyprideis torosa]CAG0896103.1 unnamed protein product [Cyprideis torosa]
MYRLSVFVFVLVCAGAMDISDDPWIFTTTTLPSDGRLVASVGNGHLGTTLFSGDIFVNGLYNGVRGESHRARIENWNNIKVSIRGEDLDSETFSLNTRTGTFTQTLNTSERSLEVVTMAHRFYTRSLITLIENHGDSSVDLDVVLEEGAPSEDIAWDVDIVDGGIRVLQGTTKQLEDPRYQQELTPVTVYATYLSNTSFLHLSPGEVFKVVTTVDFSSATAQMEFLEVMGDPDLIQSHVEAWEATWQEGEISVEGNLQLSKVIHGAMYYILSSLPPTRVTHLPSNPFAGLSPGGLANGALNMDYQVQAYSMAEDGINRVCSRGNCIYREYVCVQAYYGK